ncbi:MAG: IclR family transcriptional regulator [bacterium]
MSATNSKKRNEEKQYLVKAVINALDVLEVFIGKEEEIGVGELSRRLDLPKNKIFRLLSTLKERGFVEQNKVTEKYRLGLKVFELGQAYKSKLGLLKLAHPILVNLSVSCDESVYMAVLDGIEVVYVDMEETTKPLRIVPHLGSRAPVYCTAIGKIQLAFRDVEEREGIVKKMRLETKTKNTITDIRKLTKQLLEIIKKGYALDNEEFEEGVKCVAVPIRDYNNAVVAGICISGPSVRMSEKRIKNELLKLILDASQEISHKLGYLEGYK